MPGDSKPDHAARRYRHARNGNGGIDSICLRCHVVIASSADEWSLLDREELHVCGTQGNPATSRS